METLDAPSAAFEEAAATAPAIGVGARTGSGVVAGAEGVPEVSSVAEGTAPVAVGANASKSICAASATCLSPVSIAETAPRSTTSDAGDRPAKVRTGGGAGRLAGVGRLVAGRDGVLMGIGEGISGGGGHSACRMV